MRGIALVLTVATIAGAKIVLGMRPDSAQAPPAPATTAPMTARAKTAASTALALNVLQTAREKIAATIARALIVLKTAPERPLAWLPTLVPFRAVLVRMGLNRRQGVIPTAVESIALVKLVRRGRFQSLPPQRLLLGPSLQLHSMPLAAGRNGCTSKLAGSFVQEEKCWLYLL